MKRFYIMILFGLIMLTSCSPRIIQSVRTVKDSIYVIETVTLRDTAVIVEADSSLIRALIECDSLGRARLTQMLEYRSGKYVKPPGLSLKDNILTANAQVDSFYVFMKYSERFKQSYHRSQANENEVVIREVNRLYWWQKTLIWVGVLSLTTIVITTILKFR